MNWIDLPDLERRLSARALSVCRHYLPNGCRQGNYWIIGDVRNTPGRSMYVRLTSDEYGHRAGRWTDAATGEYGDLLDIIREARPGQAFADAVGEAERFIGNLPVIRPPRFRVDRPRSTNNMRQARGLYYHTADLLGTLGETYLTGRSIDPGVADGLRFLATCFCRPTVNSTTDAWPAILAPVTEYLGGLCAVHRIYLDPEGFNDAYLGKAPIDKPKRSLGRVQGRAVRFGAPCPLIVVAEGIENALSIRTAYPGVTVHAALTAGNLASYIPPQGTAHLLIAHDNDEAGYWSASYLTGRVSGQGIRVMPLPARTGDHNGDLRAFGIDQYRQYLSEWLDR